MPACSPWWTQDEAINRNVGGPAEPFHPRQGGAK
jgi:hypothetical protein